ncbi:MAG: hypothetical protein HXY51_04350 [Nitrospirae bacterium]|nr:hypothetical protein [Nitrospirota bacterium]
MNNKALILGSLSAVALMLAAGAASAHVGYGSSLYDGTNFGSFNNFVPTVSSNAGWISGMSNNGVNRTATVDTLADTHNNRFRFFTLTAPSSVSITVTGTANSNGASLLNPGFSLFSGQVPAGSHDGVADLSGLTPAQIATLQSPAMVGAAANTPGDGGYLQSVPAYATWSPFFDASDEVIAEGGGAVDFGGLNWGVYQSDGNVTMGNQGGLVSTMTYTGLSVGDGYNGDTLDNSVTWSGNLAAGTYSLVIGGNSLSDLTSLFTAVQAGVPNGCVGVSTSCNGTTYGQAYTDARLARNMLISMDVNGNASPVPVPAAVYLFGTGLVSLVGLARRKMKASV